MHKPYKDVPCKLGRYNIQVAYWRLSDRCLEECARPRQPDTLPIYVHPGTREDPSSSEYLLVEMPCSYHEVKFPARSILTFFASSYSTTSCSRYSDHISKDRLRGYPPHGPCGTVEAHGKDQIDLVLLDVDLPGTIPAASQEGKRDQHLLQYCAVTWVVVGNDYLITSNRCGESRKASNE
jgi:hypothetical protein